MHYIFVSCLVSLLDIEQCGAVSVVEFALVHLGFAVNVSSFPVHPARSARGDQRLGSRQHQAVINGRTVEVYAYLLSAQPPVYDVPSAHSYLPSPMNWLFDHVPCR